MKRLLSVVAFVAIIGLSAPAFAFIDGELFGGYNFSGSYASAVKTVDTNGGNYGGRVHLTTGLLFFKLGGGAFGQYTPMKYDLNSKSYDLKKTNIGPDLYLQFTLIPVLKPYIRGGVSVYESLQDKYKNNTTTKFFNTAYYGAGLGFELPVPIVTIQIFGEYLYNTRIFGDKLNVNTVNVGVSAGI
jgi:hypothetical protein